MVGHNEPPRDSIDSALPQMSDVVPADGSLFRPSHARQPSNPNVFSDDYTIDSIDAPLFSNHQRNLSFSSLDSVSTIEPRYRTVSKPGTENATRTSFLDQQHNNRTSVISPQQSEESLALERAVSRHSDVSSMHDEEDLDLGPFADEPTSSHAPTGRPSSIRKDITALNRRSVVSTTSTRSGYNPLPRAMSPYRGATGPSHPYAMYPQVGVSRTASVATVSSIRPVDSPFRGRTAPQHPYGMYPQNIDYEEDLGDQPIPVGFSATGMQSQSSSSNNADEVGDIVGPDGHLEQLPPYSRYPDGVIRPTTGRGPASIADDIRGQPERYQDEPNARSDASSGTLINVDSSEPLHPSSSQSDRSSTLVESMSEKMSRKGRQKCCGAPLWLVILLSLAMLICAMLGGVIGGVLGERAAVHRAEAAAASRTASVVTVTYTSDVSPYTASPTNFAALPTGNYQIPWTVTNASKFCVGTSDQMPSWSCQVMDPLGIEVQGVIESSSITINEPGDQTGQFNYGGQLPYNITPAQQNLSIMIDKEDPQLGPALFFQTFFDKLVIVEETQNIQQSKRAFYVRDGSGSEQFVNGQNSNTNSGSGAKPWFCWWNDTQIETFIYINQTQGSTSSSSSSSSSQAIITAQPTASTGSGQSKRDQVIAGDYPRKIKIKENRVNPNAPQAYCQQMQVNADNSVSPINGQYFKINESITTEPYSQQAGKVPCYCEWMT